MENLKAEPGRNATGGLSPNSGRLRGAQINDPVADERPKVPLMRT